MNLSKQNVCFDGGAAPKLPFAFISEALVSMRWGKLATGFMIQSLLILKEAYSIPSLRLLFSTIFVYLFLKAVEKYPIRLQIMNGKLIFGIIFLYATIFTYITAVPVVYEADLTAQEKEILQSLAEKIGRTYGSRFDSGRTIKRANAELVNGLLGMRYGDLMRAG
ncbi:Pigment dispersing factor [Trichinella spiralis]|uniref:Pigment dispersing factor n=2 Tax=Trichinella spiralis TaxID=6334 RepID=A0ABR3KAY7_TRISP